MFHRTDRLLFWTSILLSALQNFGLCLTISSVSNTPKASNFLVLAVWAGSVLVAKESRQHGMFVRQLLGALVPNVAFSQVLELLVHFEMEATSGLTNDHLF